MSLHSYHHLYRAPEGEAPVVFTFHGTGGDEQQFAGLVSQILPQAGIVSPRGDVSEFGANRFFRRKAEGVYDMDDLALRTEAMIGFIRAQKGRHPGAPTYALGYSNGANILASALFQAPDLFDRVVLMHPLIPWTPAARPGLAGRDILVTAGERDPICPMPGMRALIGYFETQGARVQTFVHPGGHDVPGAEVAAIARFLQD